MGDTLTEIAKKIRSNIYWLTLVLILLLVELIPGIEFQSDNESNTVEESIKRDILLTSNKSTLEKLEQKWTCDCSYFNIAFNKDIDDKKVIPNHQDTICQNLMNQIIAEKKKILGSTITIEKESGKSTPFFDLKFISSLYPIVFKALVLYFLISFLFCVIELGKLLKFNTKDSASQILKEQLTIENEIKFPSLKVLLPKGLLIVAICILIILFIKVFPESENYFYSYATTYLKTVKIYLGIVNLLLLLAIPSTLYLIYKRKINLDLNDKKIVEDTNPAANKSISASGAEEITISQSPLSAAAPADE